jgi:hypothetical protein
LTIKEKGTIMSSSFREESFPLTTEKGNNKFVEVSLDYKLGGINMRGSEDKRGAYIFITPYTSDPGSNFRMSSPYGDATGMNILGGKILIHEMKRKNDKKLAEISSTLDFETIKNFSINNDPALFDYLTRWENRVGKSPLPEKKDEGSSLFLYVPLGAEISIMEEMKTLSFNNPAIAKKGYVFSHDQENAVQSFSSNMNSKRVAISCQFKDKGSLISFAESISSPVVAFVDSDEVRGYQKNDELITQVMKALLIEVVNRLKKLSIPETVAALRDNKYAFGEEFENTPAPCDEAILQIKEHLADSIEGNYVFASAGGDKENIIREGIKAFQETVWGYAPRLRTLAEMDVLASKDSIVKAVVNKLNQMKSEGKTLGENKIVTSEKMISALSSGKFFDGVAFIPEDLSSVENKIMNGFVQTIAKSVSKIESVLNKDIPEIHQSGLPQNP